MKNVETVKRDLYRIFKDFRAENISEPQFIDRLTKLCKARGNKSYWWRFFKGDTFANDPKSVANSLSAPRNRQYLIECIDLAIETQGLAVILS